MAPPSDASFSSTNNGGFHKPGDGIYQQPDSDVGANIPGNVHEFRLLDNSESLQKEKQISIDPISLREPPTRVVDKAPKATGLMELPPALLPGKPKFLSYSLPNSANSSPRFSTSLLKKKFKNESQGQVSPLQRESNVAEQNTEEEHKLPLEYYLRRSKSCGEGRSFAPSEDFDLWLDKPDFSGQLNNKKHFNSFSKPDQRNNKVNHHNHHKKSTYTHKYNNNMDLSPDDGFKCGALCLFLPGFGKAKPVRSSRKEEAESENVISRTVSLEKFECGSWASSAIGDGDNHYFDLPMELIRSEANDAHSPVSAAFLFDKDLKGVLKNGSSRPTAQAAARKSHESARHVRFSTASPTSYPASPASCITPRLRKAREDFNAFLEAQSA